MFACSQHSISTMCKNVDDGGGKDHGGRKKEQESNHQNSKTGKPIQEGKHANTKKSLILWSMANG